MLVLADGLFVPETRFTCARWQLLAVDRLLVPGYKLLVPVGRLYSCVWWHIACALRLPDPDDRLTLHRLPVPGDS
jgi:hypothetical protein